VGLTLHDGTGLPASVLPWQDLINRRGLRVAEGHPYGSSLDRMWFRSWI
jgi:hypothetical protein